MAENPSLFCFEEEIDAELYARWYPEAKEQIFSMRQLLDLLHPEPVQAGPERFAAFRKLFPEGTDKEAAILQATIDFLRSAFLVTDEDLNFAFGELSSTPKNQKLKSDLIRYLDSPLANDEAAKVWSVREKLKSGTDWNREVRFFASRERSTFFEELSKSFPHRSPEPLNVEELSQWRPQTRATQGAVLTAESTLALERMVEWTSRFSGPTVLSFGGSPAELVFLKTLLKNRRLRYADLSHTDTLTLSLKQTDWVAAREDRSVPLETRLLKSRELWNRRDRNSTSRPRPIEKEMVSPSAQVTIVPFRPYQVPDGYRHLAFASKTLFDLRLPELLLTAEEIETLKLKGVSVNSVFDKIQRSRNTLNDFAKRYRHDTFLFSALPPEEVEARHFPLKAKERKAIPKAIQEPNVKLGDATFSATGLENFAQCPTKFLFAQRFRFRMQAARPEDRFALIFGQVLHKVLEHLFQQPQDQIRLSDEKWLMGYFRQIVEEHFREILDTKAHYTLLQEQFRKAIRHLPQLEATLRELRGAGRPIAFEKPFEMSIDGHRVKGFIDRIDETESGELLILDYKTGTVDFSPSHIEQGFHFQALVYLLACEKIFQRPVMGVLFYDLKQGELRRGFVRAESLSASTRKLLTRGHALEAIRFDAIRDHGIAKMKGYMDLVAQGSYVPQPSAATCGMCDYAALCRRSHGFR